MRLRAEVFFAGALIITTPAWGGTFSIIGPQSGVSQSAWPAILESVGHVPAAAADSNIFIATAGTAAAAEWQKRVESGAALILEGSSPLAASFGFRAHPESVSVIHLVDQHNPRRASDLGKGSRSAALRCTLPGATIFAKDRWSSEPLIAGMRAGTGAVLWVAAGPGAAGYERFPYLMQALSDLGFSPAFRSSRLWAFFDDSYRARADPDYLAERWRKAGISAIHVASWHFYEADAEHEEYLKRLIEACHRHGVLVYAWVELPHVSDRFWAEHPEWREKTGLLQDAQLDWRKLMNLENAECAKAITEGLAQMMRRFDWDGINLAELYFESLEGASNPARFTPMNDDVRREFRQGAGWDPIEIWSKHNDAASLRAFLDFRAGLARRMQEEWLGRVERFREFRPDLDVVLTHVDDQFDKGMKDAIGADASRVLPLLDRHAFSFLIEDPATVWNLGPSRYPEIARRYQPLTSHQDRLAIDINILDRYQDVYPTRHQTGTELFELVHQASAAFARTALYFENSILKPDLSLLANSSAVVTHYAATAKGVAITSPEDVEYAWRGGAAVDGKPWPFVASGFVRLPAGTHTVQASSRIAGLTVIDLNARLKTGGIAAEGRITFEYASDSRAIVRFRSQACANRDRRQGDS